MYQHEVSAFGEFEKHHFHNPKTENSFSIVPQFGANLLQVTLNGKPLLDGFENPEDLRANVASKSIVLFPFPNRLKEGKYSHDGEEYQFELNCATGNALHGFGYAQPMKATDISLNEDSATVTCIHVNNGAHPAYPFRFTFSITFTIFDAGNFEVSMSFRNDGMKTAPLGMGWHPYFQFDEKVDLIEMQMPVTQLVKIDEHMIPTGVEEYYDQFEIQKAIGDSSFDSCFNIGEDYEVEGEKKFVLNLKTSNGKLSYWQETGPSKYNYIQLYTPPHRNSIAIEPMTCNIDAFNNGNGLLHLKAGQSVSGAFGFSYEKTANI